MYYKPVRHLKDPQNPALGSYITYESDLGGQLKGHMLALNDENEFLVDVQGRSIRTRITGTQSKAGGGKRSKVREFSAESRNRLLHRLLTVPDEPDEFLTLTYPKEFPLTRITKTHLDNFLKRFARRFPQATMVWKLEYQERGAPHYHCCVWFKGTRGTRRFWKQWVSRVWYTIVGSGDIKHLRAGTNTQRPKGPWNRYLSKYVSKDTIPVSAIRGEGFIMYTTESVGRFWGIHNKKAFNSLQDSKLTYSINPKNWRNIRKWLNKITGRKTNRKSCSFLVDSLYTSMQIALYAQDSPQLSVRNGIYLYPSFGPKGEKLPLRFTTK